jgi:putative flippase GtrA
MIQHSMQLARFCGVSLFCFTLGLGVLTGLHELAGVHYLVAYVASFVITSTCGYLLNGRYTFAARGADRFGLMRYMLVNVGLLIVNGAALRLLVEHFHIWYLSATLLLAAINTPVSFLAHRILTYRLGLGLRYAQTRSNALAHVPQLLRFSAIGLVCFALSTVLLATLCELFHINYLVAFVATFLVSCLVGYLLNGRYTFSGHARFNGSALSRYVTVNALLLGLNTLVLPILVETWGIWYIEATVILAAVNVPITFIAHRLATYRDPPDGKCEDTTRPSTWG